MEGAISGGAIFDWNSAENGAPPAGPASSPHPIPRIGTVPTRIRVVDETLRDGLQNPSGKNPPVEHKAALLPAMVKVGVDVVSVGLPAAGGRYEADTLALCAAIRDQKLPLIATAAARTVVSDVEGIARAADKTGLEIEVYSFIGSSPIRQYVESWSTDFLVGAVTGAAQAAARHNLPFCLVTEDTTRSHPDVLRTLFRAAVDSGARRLCLCDTTGHVTPYGVQELVTFARTFLAEIGAPHVELDWHGHNDRGLGLPIALWAAAAGVDRVHGTGLGVGERVGNTPLELLVDNLGMLGARQRPSRESLVDYCDRAALALDWEIPFDHPIAGTRARAASSQARDASCAPA
ncbi:MAG: 2-isopropylmalate synthase [Polyangiaceae bacterium]